MKTECNLNDVFEVTNYKLKNSGLLLTTAGKDGTENVMTIGWGLMGRIWNEPVFMVCVRPSRHTFKLIEETNEFTVNVPSDTMDETAAYCGKVSGRDHDKFKERKLSTEKGRKVASPIISECIVHYECKVIGKTKVVPELLSTEVKEKHYPKGDYHTIYYGKLVSILRDK